MPISVITNFSINDSVPFDTRLVATSSTSMTNMLYKYAGLTTYRSDLGLNYTYNGSSWAVSSNGIYGGSGILSSDTTVNFGTVSAALNSDSNRLTFQSYSGTTGESNNSVRVENYFIRNADYFYGISYKNQFIFSESDGYIVNSGPYIMYNPEPLFGGGYGGISFGVLAPNGSFGQDELPSYERMRIDASGIIRFKPNAIVLPTTKSVNIGIDSTNTKPFIGFNWNGVSTESGQLGSYVEFENQNISINTVNAIGSTQSALFTPNNITLRGDLNLIGGFTTSKSINFGSDGSINYVISNSFGFKHDSGKGYAALLAKVNTGPVEVLKYTGTNIDILKTISVTQSATLTTYGTFNARNATNIWDSYSNPQNLDNNWTLSPESSDSGLQNDTTNTILVYVGSSTTNISVWSKTVTTNVKFPIFIINSKNYSSKRTAKAAFVNYSKSYDRYFYFYNSDLNQNGETTTYHPIPHYVEWFLKYKDDTAIDANWIKVGQIQTVNQDNYNDNGTGKENYQFRYYTQCVLVPANMDLKVKFSFPFFYNQMDKYTYIYTKVFRAGSWVTTPRTTSTEQEAIINFNNDFVVF